MSSAPPTQGPAPRRWYAPGIGTRGHRSEHWSPARVQPPAGSLIPAGSASAMGNWADKVPHLLLAGHREPSEEVVLNARGLSSARRGEADGGGMFSGCRRETESCASASWCRSRGMWSTRPPASLEQGPQRQAAWKGQCLHGPPLMGRGVGRWRAVPESAHAQEV